MKKVLITGILGQDGANMAEFLLANTDHLIYGMARHYANPQHKNIEGFKNNPRFTLVSGDLSDGFSIEKLIRDIQPDYFINFAANSFVHCSWDMPEQVFDINTVGVLRGLEAIRKLCPKCRYYSAGSSEQFGDIQYSPQNILHPFRPRSPYGASKCAAHHIVKVYRESYNLYALQGILFNHEGTKRGDEFVTRKITKGVARIYHKILASQPFEPIRLGNLDAKRDWSDSEDFVVGIWRMLNQEEYRSDLQPELYRVETNYFKDLIRPLKEYVLSSNETHSIREFVELAFREVGLVGYWVGSGLDEKYMLTITDSNTGNRYDIALVVIDKEFYRPAEVELLWGDSSPAREELKWSPVVSFKQLVSKMVTNDI